MQLVLLRSLVIETTYTYFYFKNTTPAFGFAGAFCFEIFFDSTHFIMCKHSLYKNNVEYRQPFYNTVNGFRVVENRADGKPYYRKLLLLICII